VLSIPGPGPALAPAGITASGATAVRDITTASEVRDCRVERDYRLRRHRSDCGSGSATSSGCSTASSACNYFFDYNFKLPVRCPRLASSVRFFSLRKSEATPSADRGAGFGSDGAGGDPASGRKLSARIAIVQAGVCIWQLPSTVDSSAV